MRQSINTIGRILLVALMASSFIKPRSSEAVVPVIAAYGALETLLLASAAAAAVGVITSKQNQAFRGQVGDLTTRVAQSTGHAVTAVAAETKNLYQVYRSSLKKVGPTAKPTQSAQDADCHMGVNDDPRQCCDSWFKRAENLNNAPSLGFIMVQAAKKAFQIFSMDGSVRCCVEWDSTHARFEVYHPGGEGRYPSGSNGQSYSHRGEFSCRGEAGDPCQASHQDKSDNSGEHAPRDGCRYGLNSDHVTQDASVHGGSASGASK